MQLTKYEHACFCIEKEGRTVVVDPGVFTTDFTAPESVVAIVITHHHPDHFDPEHIDAIMEENPTATIIGPADVTNELSRYDTKTVHGGDSFALHGFDFDFYGEDHAVIHPDIPKIKNVGVLIEDRVYYPGDAWTVPDKSVDTLALPIGAPWLKVSDAVEFMKTVGARLTFPTHDAILNSYGRQVYDRILESFSEQAGTEYQRIDDQTIEIE